MQPTLAIIHAAARVIRGRVADATAPVPLSSGGLAVMLTGKITREGMAAIIITGLDVTLGDVTVPGRAYAP